MDNLAQILKQEVFKYAGGGFNLKTFCLANEAENVYAVNIMDWPIYKRPAAVVVLAHIQDDKIIIDEDLTDRPLYQALMEQGIPREAIVLAYAGEAVPEG